MESYIILALICMVLFGINAIVYKAAPRIDAVSLAMFSFIVSAIGSFIYWLFFVAKKQVSLAGIGVGTLGGLISVAALITFIAALQMGKASVVNTIRALSAGVTVILAIVLLSEKLTLIKTIGIVLGIIATVLLSI
jgi:transporter family protein